MSRFPWQKSSPGRENHELHREWGKDSIFQGFITVINYPRKFWKVDPALIPAATPGDDESRVITGGPLIHLDALQVLLKSGDFDTDQLWLATKRCEESLLKESWTVEDVLYMLVSLKGDEDYYKSEWCEVIGGRVVPCDVYRIPFDAMRKCRHPKGLRVYLKFSLEDDDSLTITLVSCHEG